MKKIFYSLFVLCAVAGAMPAVAATGTFSCGAGYILASHSKIDGISAKECKKLWCRDLETNKSMGSGDRVASGYLDVLSSVSDGRNTVDCFGERKWCAGEPAGQWDPDLGIYTRGGDDGSTYRAYQKSSCFAWRLEKPECDKGEAAILQDGKWVCATSQGSTDAVRKSSVRRTGTMRRMMR